MNVVSPSNERDSERKGARRGESRRPVRTCVGCGLRDGADELLRVVATPEEIAFDLAAFISTLVPRASRRPRRGWREGSGVRSRWTRQRSDGCWSRRAIDGWRGFSSPPVAREASPSGPTPRSRRSGRARRSPWSRWTPGVWRRRSRCSGASREDAPSRGGREVSSGACSARDPSQFARFVTRASPAS
jgi:hypothetical protein